MRGARLVAAGIGGWPGASGEGLSAERGLWRGPVAYDGG